MRCIGSARAGEPDGRCGDRGYTARSMRGLRAMGLCLRVAAHSDVGRVRRKNEDAFVAADLTRGHYSASPRWTGLLEVGDRGALVAVSDGMGGAKDGDLASALVISSLAQGLSSQVDGRNSLAEITDAVLEAHHAVWAEACARGIEMGATLTALYVRGASAYVAEVGDSRAYIIRGGRITQLTKDQSYVQMLVDTGAVDADRAHMLPFRNIILQAMGLQPKLAVALGKLELRSRDCLLLCSDGLWNELSDDEVRDVVLASTDLLVATDRLIELANARGGRDNTTVVLVGVGGDLAPRTQDPIEQTYRILNTFEGSSGECPPKTI
jgi:serine/threonine protein phosphatase PrpC